MGDEAVLLGSFKMFRLIQWRLFLVRFVHLEEDLEDQLARIGLEATDAKGDKLGVSALGSQRTFVQDKEEVLSLTEKEQGDLQQVFELSRQFDYDGDVLVRSLNAEISQMESANVHDLMNTHTDIENICRLIDQSLEDLNKMDKKIGMWADLMDEFALKAPALEFFRLLWCFNQQTFYTRNFYKISFYENNGCEMGIRPSTVTL